MKPTLSSNIEWQEWGESDPLYGVSSWAGRNRRGANPWTDEEFYKFGEKVWAEMRAYWLRYGLDSGVCVEIGCGAGRITRCLASCFRHVHAFDVSESMLRYARGHVDTGRVTLHLTLI